MKVLLTGATGFIGRYVLEQLLQDNIAVVVMGRSCPPGFVGEFIRTDLLATEDFGKLVVGTGVTHLMHLAWYAEHGLFWSSPLNLQWSNATIRLVEAFCMCGGWHVIAAGTCAEYNRDTGYCREDGSLPDPSSLYGVAKDATRRLAGAVCQMHDVRFAWGRIFIPYGTGEDQRRLIPSLVQVFRNERAPFGVNADAFRDFLHVVDVAQGFMRLLYSQASGIFNIASGVPLRISDMVCQIASFFRDDPDKILRLTVDRPGEPAMLVGENCKLMTCGWRARYSLLDYVNEIIESA